MRADAEHNRERILRAARQIFVDEGPDAPLDEIARRAGVGIATLYRRFPSREELIRSVALDTLHRLYLLLDEAIERESDPFEALRTFMHGAVDLKVGAVMPSLFGRAEFAEVFEAARDPSEPLQRLIVRVQEAALLRGDVALGDVIFMIIRLTRPLPGRGIQEDAALAHRQLEIYLDGLRPSAAWPRQEKLPGPAVSAALFRRIRDRMSLGVPAEPRTSRRR